MERQPPDHFRRDIQGIRAIAVGVVLAFHAGLPVHGGFIGVDVFFVISGYVITSSIRRDQERTDGFRFRDFYFRRFRRLWPPLAVVVTLTVFASALLSPPTVIERPVVPTALGALALSANVAIFSTTGGYFDAPAAANPLLHTWSLSVEEQIYLVVPLLLAVAWRFRRSRALVGIGIAAVSGLSFLMMLVGTSPSGPTRLVGALRIGGILNRLGSGTPSFLFGFYSPFVRLWEFAVGGVMYFVVNRLAEGGRKPAPWFTPWAGLISILVAAIGIRGQVAYPGPWTVLPVFGTALLLLPQRTDRSSIVRILEHKSMQWIGDRSYSIYLWHWPFVVFALTNLRSWPQPAVIGTALSLIPAVASHRWVERPFRVRKSTSWRGTVALGAGAMALPGLLIVAASSAAAREFGSSTLRSWQSAIATDHAGHSRGCDAEYSPSVITTCTWNGDVPGPPVYVVGDSFADHFSEGMIEASTTLGRPMVLKTVNACPFLDLPFLRAGYDSTLTDVCLTHTKKVMAYLLQSRPGTVVISNAPIYHSLSEFSIRVPGRPAATQRADKLRAMTASMQSMVRSLRKHGHHVVLVLPTPLWSSWDASRCSTIQILAGSCKETLDRSSELRRFSDLRTALRGVGRSSGASVIDLFPSLCPQPRCQSTIGRIPRYRDGAHLSVSQSRALAPVFARAIASDPVPG